VDIYNLPKNPFISITQAHASHQLVILERKTFTEFANRLGDPKCKEVVIKKI